MPQPLLQILSHYSLSCSHWKPCSSELLAASSSEMQTNTNQSV